MVELDEIMRQREDGQIAQLLCCVRTATCTEQDIVMLQSRELLRMMIQLSTQFH